MEDLGFTPASELGPSPSRVEELEALVTAQAIQLEKFQDAEPQQAKGPGLKPEERQKLLQVISDLDGRIKELELKAERQDMIIEGLQKQKGDLEKAITDIRDMAKVMFKQIYGRVTKLEDRHTQQKTDLAKAHIDKLANELLSRSRAGQKGITYAEAAKIIGRDKVRVIQLRALIAADSRFCIIWHPKKKNTKIICLKKHSEEVISKFSV
jgi:uncharacterized coiled-coil protein SlyX